jgi:hypothetical protein
MPEDTVVWVAVEWRDLRSCPQKAALVSAAAASQFLAELAGRHLSSERLRKPGCFLAVVSAPECSTLGWPPVPCEHEDLPEIMLAGEPELN